MLPPATACCAYPEPVLCHQVDLDADPAATEARFPDFGSTPWVDCVLQVGTPWPGPWAGCLLPRVQVGWLPTA